MIKENETRKSPMTCFSAKTSEALKRIEEAKKLREILGYHPVPEIAISKMIQLLVWQLECKNAPECCIYIDVFNYGYILGQRAERARKKHKLSND